MSSEKSTWGPYKLPIFQKNINFSRLLFGAGGVEGREEGTAKYLVK